MASLYFANRRSRTFLTGNNSKKNRNSSSKFVVERTPTRNTTSQIEEYYSRPVLSWNNNNGTTSQQVKYTESTNVATPSHHLYDQAIGSLLIERKIPVKVEPRVALANERTFLLWMHSCLWLFGASGVVLTNSNGDTTKILFGSMILPIALVFIVYSIFQFKRRAEMLKRKAPGPYEDTVGPILFAVLLMIAIVVQFVIKLRLYQISTSE